MKSLLERYATDMAARGKDDASVGRVAYTARAIETVVPELLSRPVSAISDADTFSFRKIRRQTSLLALSLRGRISKLRIE